MTHELISEGLAAASDTRVVEVARGLLPRIPAILAEELFDGRRPALVVADERTWDAAGRSVFEGLQGLGVPTVEPVIFPGEPPVYADLAISRDIQARLAETDATGVAVGSGTINDLVKLAAGELGPERHVTGHVRQAPVQGGAVLPGIATQ